MDPQTLIVALVIAVAAIFVGRRIYRTLAAARRPKDGCGGDCDCSPGH